jgi:DNA-binding LacI/PurR family transcriptional regulator
MGYDSDDEMARGEVGKCGVAVDTLADMEVLFDGIDPEAVTTSMTINAPANAVWAMYLAMAERKGADLAKVGGTIQNDILKEFIAQKEYIVPPAPSVDLVIDTFEWGPEHVPRWNFVSVSGYHIREAGSTAVQELAFTLADGVHYVRRAQARGLDVDTFAPRISFFFNVHNDFFEEIAKFRAARRIWARRMRHEFGARDPRSWTLRTHAQTAGVSLTAQQPLVNVARVAIQALAGVLAGTNSLHTNAHDEALALPTEEAATLALRTQQVIAHETGVAAVADPLGGSWYLERLTDEMERRAEAYLERIDELGGVEAAIEDAGLHLMVSSGHARAEDERSAIQFLKQRRSDALIVQAEALSDAELIDLADRAGVPVVVFGRHIPELEPVCVHLDNEAGGRIATEHLLRHGHRRIAHIAGPLRFPDARHRLQGYRDALDDAGIPYDDHLVVEGDFREEGGRAAMERLLDRTTEIDAAFVANDQMAAGALRAARDRGLDVPLDLSLVGYDDVLLAQYLSPTLTTVRQPLFDMGRAAGDIAIALLEQKKVEVRTRFEPELVVRESVARRAT